MAEQRPISDTIVVTVEVQLDDDGTGRVLVNGQDQTALLFPDGFPGRVAESHG